MGEYKPVYEVYISELQYGSVRVRANSKEEAEEYAKSMYEKEHRNIRWHDHEMTDVSAVESKDGGDKLKKSIREMLETEEYAANCVKFMQAFDNEYQSDDEVWRRKGFRILKAILEDDTEGMLLALCGWSTETLIAKAKSMTDFDIDMDK